MESKYRADIVINKEKLSNGEDVFVVQCTNLGIASQGSTTEEAIKNIKEAIELYLEEQPEATCHCPSLWYKSNNVMLTKVINEVLDCYFLHRSEGLLEAAMRLEQVSKELGIIKWINGLKQKTKYPKAESMKRAKILAV